MLHLEGKRKTVLPHRSGANQQYQLSQSQTSVLYEHWTSNDTKVAEPSLLALDSPGLYIKSLRQIKPVSLSGSNPELE